MTIFIYCLILSILCSTSKSNNLIKVFYRDNINKMSKQSPSNFKNNQKLGSAKKLVKYNTVQKSNLDQFLLDKDKEHSFKRAQSQMSISPNKNNQKQQGRTPISNKKYSIDYSENTQKRLISQLNKGNYDDRDINSRPESQFVMNGISFQWIGLLKFLKLMILSYEFNLLDQLSSIDPQLTQKIKDMLKLAPGYKPVQYIFTFYTLKYNYVIGLLAALIYPLPYSVLFMIIPGEFTVPFLAIFALAGMRSGTLALLLKYCLHFPKSPFHWIVFVFTVFIGVFLPNNYIFMVLYAISIFLSFYLAEDSDADRNQTIIQDGRRSHNSSVRAVSNHAYESNENKDLYKEYKMIDGLPETYPVFSICLIVISIIGSWLLSRYYDQIYLYAITQIVPISLLSSSKQMLAFFPSIFSSVLNTPKLSSGTYIAASFLFPGPHSKAFMFLFNYQHIGWAILGYLSLYLPPILLTSIFIAYRHHFYTQTYKNIRMSIQAVGNGLVLSLVVMVLQNEQCFFNMVCYSSIVILVVAKLYKLRELFAITLGIFLISARTIILHVNKGISFTDQACLNEV